MCWDAAQSSAFHAHEGSRCFVKVLSGQLREQQVPYPKQPDNMSQQPKVHTCDDRVLSADEVTYIDDSIGLHKVTNMSKTKPAITLHVYMPAYKKCRIFDTGNNAEILTSKSIEVTFNSVEGQVIS